MTVGQLETGMTGGEYEDWKMLYGIEAQARAQAEENAERKRGG